MSFHPQPQETRNRKLLEELAEQKKRLQGGLRGGHAPSSATGPSTSTSSSVPGSSTMMPAVGPPPNPMASGGISMISLAPDAAGMTSQQRTALQYAHANSVGYFITQDSSFGNLILPVLPRYAEK